MNPETHAYEADVYMGDVTGDIISDTPPDGIMQLATYDAESGVIYVTERAAYDGPGHWTTYDLSGTWADTPGLTDAARDMAHALISGADVFYMIQYEDGAEHLSMLEVNR